MRYLLVFISLVLLHLPANVHAQERVELRTCKVGSVVYTEDSRGSKCIPPLTPEGIRLITEVLKATAPPPVSEEYKKNERFCQVYRERNDVPNQLKYCGALSEMGSMGATEIVCSLHYKLDFRSKEAAYYCGRASEADRVPGHFFSALIHANSADYVNAAKYMYRGVDRSFLYKKVRTKLDQPAFSSPANSLTKFLTEGYLLYAAEGLYGASLESLGFPKIEIDASMTLSSAAQRSTIVNDWIGLVETYPLGQVTSPQRVSFTIFVVPAGETTENVGGRIQFVNGLAHPIYCYLKDENGVILSGDNGSEAHKAACGYLAVYGRFNAAVDINGNYAPSFVRGTAEIRRDKVVLLN
jgi:hypothetical protein